MECIVYIKDYLNNIYQEYYSLKLGWKEWHSDLRISQIQSRSIASSLSLNTWAKLIELFLKYLATSAFSFLHSAS